MARKSAGIFFLPFVVAVTSGVIGFVYVTDHFSQSVESSTPQTDSENETSRVANMKQIERMVFSTIAHDERVLQFANTKIANLERELQDLRHQQESSYQRLAKLRPLKEALIGVRSGNGTLKNQNDTKVKVEERHVAGTISRVSKTDDDGALFSVNANSLLTQAQNGVMIDDSSSAKLAKATKEFASTYDVGRATMYVSPSTPTNVVKALTNYVIKKFNWDLDYMTTEDAPGSPFNVRIDVEGKKKETKKNTAKGT